MKTQFVIVFIALLCTTHCSQRRVKYEYPALIVEHNLEREYDLAKCQIYKLNSNNNCNCMGLVYNQNGSTDTIKLLHSVVQLINISFHLDTITMFFDFSYNNNSVFAIPDMNYECYGPIGIVFLRELFYPAYAIVGHKAYVDLADRYWDSIRTSQIHNCISNDLNISQWLKDYYIYNSTWSIR